MEGSQAHARSRWRYLASSAQGRSSAPPPNPPCRRASRLVQVRSEPILAWRSVSGVPGETEGEAVSRPGPKLGDKTEFGCLPERLKSCASNWELEPSKWQPLGRTGPPSLIPVYRCFAYRKGLA